MLLVGCSHHVVKIAFHTRWDCFPLPLLVGAMAGGIHVHGLPVPGQAAWMDVESAQLPQERALQHVASRASELQSTRCCV